MTLGKTRIHQVGETPYPWEKEAIDFAIDVLPGSNPYQLWALTELLDPSSGRLYEIDMLIIGYGALYLVEVKSGPGRYSGDQVDWYRTPPDGSNRWMEAPYPLANKKAKVLKSRLGAKMRGGYPAPWIQPLVFLSSPDADLALTEEGRTCVVTRDTFARAITHGEFPGAMSGTYNRRIAVPQSREIAQALEAIGIRPRAGKAMVGSYTLGDVLLEGAGYQDRKAVHKDNKSIKRRARIYLVPEQTSVERRQQLRRAADREAQLLNEVREHENVLTCTDFVSDAPLGPTVLFDDFENGIPLDAFLRKPPGLDFMDRVEIIKQAGRALAYCHRKNVFHGDVSPGSVLVRSNSEGALDVRLFNLQLGHGKEVESTRHWTALISDRASVYAAPELREGYAERSVAADIYSLGALAYYILTGTPPGESVADVEAKLDKSKCLDPEIVDETISGDVAELIREATSLQTANRPDDVTAWIELLLEHATSPEKEAVLPEVNPLEAQKGDRLTGDFEVVGFLGHGATSRVLRVRRDGAEYALKVSLSELYDELLEQEAEVLSKLRHANILQLHDVLTLNDRTALLLDLAGEHTMQIELRKEGSIAPEYAVRYGDQLLSTLTYLEEEEEGVIHKDIKPANLGVGKRKKQAHRLTLFDFSLANVPPSQLRVGTAAYRDPFLKERGKWDAAADRWSAAVTLHEALTGVRPALEDPGSAHPRVCIAAERFDPALRDRLTDFFTRAFLPDAAERHTSAKKMAERWRRCFEDPDHVSTIPIAATEAVPPKDPTWNQEILSAIEAETLIETLPLSPLAKSALDRAGLIRAGDLLSLPENRLSAIRGVGTKVAAAILAFRRAWVEAREIKETAIVPFFAGYRGEDRRLDATTVSAEAASALTDAGIFTLAGLAESPKRQIVNLANRHGFDTAPLQQRLEEENRKADELSHPSTLEGWIGALLPNKSSWRYPRRLFGIEAPFTGRLDVLTKEVAGHAKVTTGAVSIKMGKAREAWAAHGAIHELQDLVKRILDETGGAIRLERAGEQLLARLPHDKGAEKEGLYIHAGALVRVVAELEKDEEQGLRFLRLKDGRPWILANASFAKVVKRLGEAADRLAMRSPLASPGEVERQLREAASGSTLANLPAGRLAGIAAEASENGARSSRLEIYPRDIGPKRLLELSAAQLRSGLTPTEVVARVAVRFPEASPLPGRPELDGLLEIHRLDWNAESGRYERPGESQQTSLATQFTSMTRLHTALPRQAKDMSEAAIAAREFDEKIDVALERRSFRLLGVTADQANLAALALAAKMQVQPVSFDRLFLSALEKKMAAQNVQPEIVHRTDREGPTGSQWHMLTSFAAKVAEDAAEELLPARKPLLLVQPGLMARYGLKDFLNRLVQSAGEEASEAIFLLVPCRGTSGVPRINGDLAVPGVRASQTLWVARSWIANAHNAAAKEVG